MSVLILGLVLFLGMHCLPMFSDLRNGLQQRLGANAYRAAYSIVSLAGFALIIWGMARTEFEPLWQPPVWGLKIPLWIMPLALVLVVAGNFPNNIRRGVRHPMVLGTALWAGAHLLANGDLASTVLFGSFGIWAIADTLSAFSRQPKAGIGRQPLWRDGLAIALGLALFAVLAHFHAVLFGVAVMP